MWAALILVIVVTLPNAGPCERGDALYVGSVSDSRFAAVRDTNTPCDLSWVRRTIDAAEWAERASALRQQILASAGLLPVPEKAPLDARVFGRIDRSDYTVEKVCFRSAPGLFVAGNLYRPRGTGPFPAVLNPHGHWGNGRYENSEACSVAGRCINFARQGYVAFSYDMIGFGDSKITAHDLGGLRERLWGVSLGGLQLLNSIRALDFLQSLPDVDRDRVACTGASGGGTQTFLLTAVDERVKVAAPVNMVSATMQGGCVCENPPNLRIDTDNVEIAALAAPRPLLLVSAAGDWTKNVPDLEFPAVGHVYELLGAPERASCVRIDADHNYNQQSREAVYSWFGQWLPKEPLPLPLHEKPFEVEKPEDLAVYEDGAFPAGALGAQELCDGLIDLARSSFASAKPTDRRGLDRFREAYLPVFRQALALTVEPRVDAEARGESTLDGVNVAKLVVCDAARGARIPALLFSSPEACAAVLMVSEQGKTAALDRTGSGPHTVVRELVDRGVCVLAIDCFGVGEHVAPDGSPDRGRPESFFDTYNRTDTAERVYDVVVAARYLASRTGASRVGLTGMGKGGLWSLLAAPFIEEAGAVVVDAAGFDSADDGAFVRELYVPCLRRAGDFSTAMALTAPRKLFVHNTQGRFDVSWGESAFAAAGAAGAFRAENDPAACTEIVRCLTGD